MNEHVIQQVTWQTHSSELADIRNKVFIEEQGVPKEIELDEHDQSLPHFAVFVGDKMIACARLFPDGKLSRMAVLPDYRGQGVGEALMAYIIEYAKNHLGVNVYMSAQSHAVPFYEKQGFQTIGEEYSIVDILHRDMVYNPN